jgi:mono/diheme cytochrome c family protein
MRHDAVWHECVRSVGRARALGVVLATLAAAPAAAPLYQVLDGKVDAATYNGYRRYNAVCSHCHGPDGAGSSFAPALVDRLDDIATFRRVVVQGVINGTSTMKSFGDDPNVVPYIDDIYAYLQARHDGAVGRGRPARQDP